MYSHSPKSYFRPTYYSDPTNPTQLLFLYKSQIITTHRLLHHNRGVVAYPGVLPSTYLPTSRLRRISQKNLLSTYEKCPKRRQESHSFHPKQSIIGAKDLHNSKRRALSLISYHTSTYLPSQSTSPLPTTSE